MKLTLLCNAGLAIEEEGQVLLIDLPNERTEPFFRLPDEIWQQILNREPPYDRVAGFYFTHEHPDHFDPMRLLEYHQRWPKVPIFLPKQHAASGRLRMGAFHMRYARMDHAPIPDPPVHVVTVVQAGERKLYLPADAKLDCEAHRAFLQGERMDCAVWNSMFLSRPETRRLLQETSSCNLIYHMPQEHPDAYGLWKKLENNLRRYPEELLNVKILEQSPTTVSV